MRADIQTLENSNEIVVQADKTRNMYLIGKDKYEQLVKSNVTKNYMKSSKRVVDISDNKSAKIAKNTAFSRLIFAIQKNLEGVRS